MKAAFAWVLILLGLVGVVGGLGMFVTFATQDRAAAENRAAQAKMNPSHPTANMPYRNQDAFAEYGSSTAYIIGGALMVFVGIKLRWPSTVTPRAPR